MLVPKLEKQVNGFYVKEKVNPEEIIGIQHPDNEMAIVYVYDKDLGRHVAKVAAIRPNGQLDF